ncbi:MAG: hypothetical protein B7Y25_01545 [Alphaproteobacteria bacterium 16-39-46]|nr:MAG: hypothetical protein B7Y25_01545 [Alphaproteobacteria bacterium 16-39-46]OZA44011.1 MAG: hypothetical protein B7X84_01530 [Alphaproteobacteria bacterium 17-39-52]HQS84181.1 hypothetical protein [Alphaproteobacteria bacterium]HQS93448.1 hypothetical protein [Alphaproteobacteria bacterium]
MKNLFSLSFLYLTLFCYGIQATLALDDNTESENGRPIFHYVAEHLNKQEIETFFYSFETKIASDILKTLNKLNLRGIIILEEDHPHISTFFDVIKGTPKEHLSSMLTEIRDIMTIFECNTPEFLAQVSQGILEFYTSDHSAIPKNFNTMALELKKAIEQKDAFEGTFSYLRAKTHKQILGFHEVMEKLFGQKLPDMGVIMDSFCALSENQAAGWAQKLSGLFQNPSFGEEPRSTQLVTIRVLSRLTVALRGDVFSLSRTLTEGLQENGKKFNVVLSRFSSQEEQRSKLEDLHQLIPLMASLGNVEALDLDAFEQIVDNVIAFSSVYQGQFKEIIRQLTSFNLYAKDLQIILNSFVQKDAKKFSFQPPKDIDSSYPFIRKLYQKEMLGGAVVVRRSYILSVFLQLSQPEREFLEKALDQKSLQENPEHYFLIAESLCKTPGLSEAESIQSLKDTIKEPKKLHKTVKSLLKSAQKQVATSKQLLDPSLPTESVV